jgi:ribosomal protein S18 acetylase RimI-like enzyme
MDLVLERATQNLEETYIEVGAQGESAWIERWEGGSACLSSLNHPVSNFAVVRGMSRARSIYIRELAIGRRAFNVYILPGLDQSDSIRGLENSGFRDAGRLHLMVGSGDEPKRAGHTMERARDFEERLCIARFMARQFFSRQTSALRESIALSTAKADVELARGSQKDLVCAGMLSRSLGALGIYNLCVAAEQRERGYGTELLAALVALAESERALATLQCDPQLEPWYARRGFQSIGSIAVLTLDGKLSHAII